MIRIRRSRLSETWSNSWSARSWPTGAVPLFTRPSCLVAPGDERRRQRTGLGGGRGEVAAAQHGTSSGANQLTSTNPVNENTRVRSPDGPAPCWPTRCWPVQCWLVQ